jgi:hypothetical protein
MRVLWCWRCKANVPMLDEDEFASVSLLYREAFGASKEFRQQWGIPLEQASIHDRFKPVRLRYEQLTGMKECHENAIMHHRISMYGEPCKSCGKPLRTPSAKICGACMHPAEPTRD